MKAICQILPALDSGGVERGTLEIAEALQQAHMPNLVISNGGKQVVALEKMGVKHICLPVHSKNLFKAIITACRLHKILKNENVGLVHVRSRMPAWIAKFALLGTDIPMIATYHGTYGIKPEWIKKRYNRVMLSGKKVIAVSEHIKKHLIQNYQTPADFIQVIPRGADVDMFDEKKVSENDKKKMRQDWGVSKDRPILLLPGRRTRIKGHFLVLEALKILARSDIQCVFLGGDQGNSAYTQELLTKIKEQGLDKQVKVIDFCTDMPTAYALSDVVISATTKPESFGRTVPEAQLMNALVVAANHGGAAETIKNGETGFHFKPNDSADLARALKKVLALDTSQRKRMQQSARENVLSCYTTEKMCAATLALYRNFLKQ